MLDDVLGRQGEGEAATSVIECDQDAERRRLDLYMQFTSGRVLCACLVSKSQPPRRYESGPCRGMWVIIATYICERNVRRPRRTEASWTIGNLEPQ